MSLIYNSIYLIFVNAEYELNSKDTYIAANFLNNLFCDKCNFVLFFQEKNRLRILICKGFAFVYENDAHKRLKIRTFVFFSVIVNFIIDKPALSFIDKSV